ncbi:MAG TPA: ABC transporter permease subunit [Candidatus Limnocylindrales bacterium]|nr:ABC transporter permease subunit [Candidatus Limnocylindrales bacterium]
MSDVAPVVVDAASGLPAVAGVDAPGGADAAAAVARRPVRVLRRPRVRGAFSGVVAVGVKELRGRMRGRRAFVILTVYLVLLASFAWMLELILERRYAGSDPTSAAFASAQIGQGVFIGLLMLETLLVVALAPAFTAGAISMEREKQTLDMLATTPVSSVAIVIGKLFSALTYLFILIVASIPLTAVVFVFGGVAPDDVVRGYLVLFATAIGLGSVGLFCSALMRRTQAATIATYFVVLAATLGSFFVFYFWNTMTNGAGNFATGFGPLTGRPPEALIYLNPYFAQADVVCGVENGFGEWCGRIAFVSDRPVFGGITVGSPPEATKPLPGGFLTGGGVNGIDQPVVQPFGVVRDSFWPKSAAAWLGLSAVLIAASVQLVTPTRRWRPRRPSWLRRPARSSPG